MLLTATSCCQMRGLETKGLLGGHTGQVSLEVWVGFRWRKGYTKWEKVWVDVWCSQTNWKGRLELNSGYSNSINGVGANHLWRQPGSSLRWPESLEGSFQPYDPINLPPCSWVFWLVLLFSLFKIIFRDFPGGPVVKTLCFCSRGRGFSPWSGN